MHLRDYFAAKAMQGFAAEGGLPGPAAAKGLPNGPTPCCANANPPSSNNPRKRHNVGTTETMIQPKVTGYRQLTATEAALMNEIKAEGVKLRAGGGARATDGLDQRWVSIRATDLQTGLMALTRGVAEPTPATF